ncbi:MAG: M20/M25/M40 family metallo-hydrolase, partial [Phycisphaeraceae bacterium]|nr:M20/M25/M40 family metallo-hydrolase [Phycisphaeraceae bacterium]
TLCCDTPGVPDDMAITKAGHGAGLMVMDSSVISDRKLLEQFESLAKEKNIKAQRTILPRGGTDASAIQRANSGYRIMNLVCGTRYIHTVTEMIHLDDLHACRDLLATFLAAI